MRLHHVFFSTALLVLAGCPDPTDEPGPCDDDPDSLECICDRNPDDIRCNDADSDGDGVPDDEDQCEGDDATGDSDGDGVCDDRDECRGDDATGDLDADGICDDEDPCPRDSDANGADSDLDDDGVCNSDDPCPELDPNDADNDGEPDCDPADTCFGDDTTLDLDRDGICGDLDLCTGDDATGDSDNDGVCDDVDPCPDDANDDSDGDGVCDSDDLCTGDDASGDTDGDGLCDDSDPCTGASNVDGDGDGVCDDVDPCPDDNPDDTDGDGVCDSDDQCVGDDATGDSDGDGICDDEDGCQGDDASGDSDGDGLCDDIDPPDETGAGALSPDDLSAGDLVITELHIDPEGCVNNQGQYVEIKNLSGQLVNLNGLFLQHGANFYVVNTNAYVQPDEYALAKANTLLDCGFNLSIDFLWSSSAFQLSPSGNIFTIANSSDAIDTVNYAAIQLGQGTPTLPGRSLVLLPGLETASDNDVPDNWCMSDDPINAQNWGTPGAVAGPCYIPPGHTGGTGATGDTGDTDTDTDTDTDDTLPGGCDSDDTGCEIRDINSIDPRDLVITEIATRPLDCTAPLGQYFEIHNTSDTTIDLDGLQFNWASSQNVQVRKITQAPDMLIQPGQSLAVAYQPGPQRTSGCYAYADNRLYYTGATLPTTATGFVLRIKDALGQTIHSVDFRSPTFRLPLGQAVGVDPGVLATPGVVANLANWCEQTSSIPGGVSDLGTPSRPNDVCPIIIDTDTGDIEVPGRDTCLGQNPNRELDGLLASNELCPDDLVITEFKVDTIDCALSVPRRAQYIEVYNNASLPVDLNNLTIDLGASFQNYTLEPARGQTASSARIAPGEYGVIILFDFASTCHIMETNYAVDGPNRLSTVVPLGVIRLESQFVVDQIDATGWDLTPGHSFQLDDTTYPAALRSVNNDDELFWCTEGPNLEILPGPLGGGTGQDQGTPGAPNECIGTIETGVDTFAPDTSDTYVQPEPEDTDPTDTDDRIIAVADALQPGDLLLTEVMFDPVECSAGAEAQYIEVLNTRGDVWIDPVGLTVEIDNFPAVPVLPLDAGDTLIAPGEYVVLKPRSGSAFCHPTAQPRFEVPGVTVRPGVFRLTNAAFSQIGPIDRVDFTGWRIPYGASLQLAEAQLPGPTDPEPDRANNLQSSWCPASEFINPNANPGQPDQFDRGSPGEIGLCGSFPPDPNDTSDTAVFFDSGDTGVEVITADQINLGEVLITEIMNDAGCSDTRAEYIEVYNNGNRLLDIGGVRLRINGSSPYVVPPNRLLPPGRYTTFVRNGSPRCYAPTSNAALAYPGTSASELFPMDGGGNNIQIQAPNGTVIDAVPSDVWTLQQAQVASWDDFQVEGRSLNLNPANYAVFGNDSPRAWCQTREDIAYQLPWGNGEFDYGSPGRPNDNCALPEGPDETGILIETADTGSDVIIRETADEEFIPLDDPSLQPGDIIVTEFHAYPSDCSPASTAQYIEVFNRRNQTIDLRGLTIRDEQGGEARILGRALVAANRYAVLRASPTGDANVPLCYDFPGTAYFDGEPDPVSFGGVHLDQNGDRIELRRDDGLVFDVVDYRGFPSSFRKAWELSAGNRNAVANDDFANWCQAVDILPGGSSDYGSPGLAPSCTPSLQPDTGDTADDDPFTRSVDELVPGDLILTEMMIDPDQSGCDGDLGAEYIEIRNMTDEVVDLYGLEIRKGPAGSASATILDTVLLAPGEFASGARIHQPGRCYLNNADFFYPVLLMDNAGDQLQLVAYGTIIDRVDFRSWGSAPTGASLQLDPSAYDAAANDDKLAWCPSEAPVRANATDLGTPGGPNLTCAIYEPIDTNDTSVDDPTTDPDTDTAVDTAYPDDTGAPPTGGGPDAEQLGAGDLVISELMVAPTACDDSRAEYIEIYNPGSIEVDLRNLVVETPGGTFTIVAATPLRAGRYALLIPDRVPNCYDLQAVADAAWGQGGLADVGGVVTLRNSTFTIDTVDYGAFPNTLQRASWNLDVNTLSSTGNDVPDNWCPSVNVVPGGAPDMGTPGFANTACLPVDPVETGIVPVDDTADTFTFDTANPPRPIEEALPGDILITEIMIDPRECTTQNAGEYIEIYNNSQSTWDLDGLLIGVDTTAPFEIDVLPGRTLLEPGEYYVAQAFPTGTPCYTFPVDLRYSAVPLNDPINDPSELVYLASSAAVIDVVRFGQYGFDEGRALMLDPNRIGTQWSGGAIDFPTQPTFVADYVNDDPAYWCSAYFKVPGATTDKGNPGQPNPRCLGVGEEVPHTGDYVAHVNEVEIGELVITEMMIQPTGCASQTLAEYIEVMNLGFYAVDLDGLVIQIGGAFESEAIVSGSVVVEPGDVALIRRSDLAGCYPGLTPDALAPSLSLPDDGAIVHLRNVHTMAPLGNHTIPALDTVDYSSFGVRSGRAFALEPGSEDATLNDDESAWCFQEETIGATADQGTPGEPNTPCFAPAQVTDVEDVTPGGLIISEVLFVSAECGEGTQDAGYVEVLNTSPEPIDLRGLWLRLGEQGAVRQLDRAVILDPGERGLFGFNTFGCLPLVYDWEVPNLPLNRNGADIILEAPQNRVLDVVPARGWGHNAGRSWQVAPNFEDAVSNDEQRFWCVSENTIDGLCSLGTPGEPNDCVADTALPADTGDSAVPQDTVAVETAVPGDTVDTVDSNADTNISRNDTAPPEVPETASNEPTGDTSITPPVVIPPDPSNGYTFPACGTGFIPQVPDTGEDDTAQYLRAVTWLTGDLQGNPPPQAIPGGGLVGGALVRFVAVVRGKGDPSDNLVQAFCGWEWNSIQSTRSIRDGRCPDCAFAFETVWDGASRVDAVLVVSGGQQSSVCPVLPGIGPSELLFDPYGGVSGTQTTRWWFEPASATGNRGRVFTDTGPGTPLQPYAWRASWERVGGTFEFVKNILVQPY